MSDDIFELVIVSIPDRVLGVFRPGTIIERTGKASVPLVSIPDRVLGVFRLIQVILQSEHISFNP